MIFKVTYILSQFWGVATLTTCSILNRSIGQKLYTHKQSEVNTKCVSILHKKLIAINVKLLLSKHTPLNPCWLVTQMTHQPWQCITLCEMDIWKLTVAYLVCDIISCCILPWINPSAMVCISKDPYSTDGGVLNIYLQECKTLLTML